MRHKGGLLKPYRQRLRREAQGSVTRRGMVGWPCCMDEEQVVVHERDLCPAIPICDPLCI